MDEYEVRKWDAWYRHITLSLLAHAYLEVLRSNRANEEKTALKRDGGGPELIPLTVPEVRRMILALAGPEEECEFRLG